MPYTPPALNALRASVARDLRDPTMKTFTTQELNDLIKEAVVEVGRIYPKQQVQELPVIVDGQESYPTDVERVFRVEIIKAGKVVAGVPNNMHPTTGQGGWDLHGGHLYLPQFVTAGLVADESPTIRVWGYWRREALVADTDVLDGSEEFEMPVRTYATLVGYQRLQNDRVLFQQWLTNTGNTDISPNQLAQTADMYQSQWREQRMRLRQLQRV